MGDRPVLERDEGGFTHLVFPDGRRYLVEGVSFSGDDAKTTAYLFVDNFTESPVRVDEYGNPVDEDDGDLPHRVQEDVRWADR